MALDPLHRERQLKAIALELAAAPKIQEDLKEKFGYGENKFFYNDLVEYRINNSREDIAEDLASYYNQTVEERYNLINEQPDNSVGSAFRGYHNEDFMPDYELDGLLGKITNDMIVGIRHEITGRKSGRKNYELGVGIHALTPEELSKNGLIGGLKTYERGKGIHALTFEERSENSRKVNEARGHHVWSLEELVDIANFREESFNHSSKLHPNSPNWKYTTSKMNEKYGENYTTNQVILAYRRNKDLLTDEEE